MTTVRRTYGTVHLDTKQLYLLYYSSRQRLLFTGTVPYGRGILQYAVQRSSSTVQLLRILCSPFHLLEYTGVQYYCTLPYDTDNFCNESWLSKHVKSEIERKCQSRENV